jgi:hypothetical protein
MFITFSLNNPEIRCDKICHELEKLIAKYRIENSNLSDSLIVITIKTITDSQNLSGPLGLPDKTIQS